MLTNGTSLNNSGIAFATQHGAQKNMQIIPSEWTPASIVDVVAGAEYILQLNNKQGTLIWITGTANQMLYINHRPLLQRMFIEILLFNPLEYSKFFSLRITIRIGGPCC